MVLNNLTNKFSLKYDMSLVNIFFILYTILLVFWSLVSIDHGTQTIALFLAYTMLIAYILLKVKHKLSISIFILINIIIKILFMFYVSSDEFFWREGLFHEDDTKYFHGLALIVKESIENFNLIMPNELIKYGRNGMHYSYILGFFYFLFDVNEYIIPIIHIVMQSFTILFLYKISKIFLPKNYIKIVIIIFIFAPSSFHWYLFGVKETFISMLLIMSMYFMIKIYLVPSKNRLIYVLLSFMVWYILFIDRIYMALFFMLLHVIILFNMDYSKNVKILIKFIAIILFIIVGYILYTIAFDFFIKLMSINTVGSSSMFSGLTSLPYPLKVLKLSFTPLPHSVTLVISNVHIIQGYNFFYNFMLVVFSVYGFYKLYKEKNKIWMMYLPFVMFILSVSLISSGINRMRDDFVPFLVLFAVFGLMYCFKQDKFIKKV